MKPIVLRIDSLEKPRVMGKRGKLPGQCLLPCFNPGLLYTWVHWVGLLRRHLTSLVSTTKQCNLNLIGQFPGKHLKAYVTLYVPHVSRAFGMLRCLA